MRYEVVSQDAVLAALNSELIVAYVEAVIVPSKPPRKTLENIATICQWSQAVGGILLTNLDPYEASRWLPILVLRRLQKWLLLRGPFRPLCSLRCFCTDLCRREKGRSSPARCHDISGELLHYHGPAGSSESSWLYIQPSDQEGSSAWVLEQLRSLGSPVGGVYRGSTHRAKPLYIWREMA
jgi:hypothetical protein